MVKATASVTQVEKVELPRNPDRPGILQGLILGLKALVGYPMHALWLVGKWFVKAAFSSQPPANLEGLAQRARERWLVLALVLEAVTSPAVK